MGKTILIFLIALSFRAQSQNFRVEFFSYKYTREFYSTEWKLGQSWITIGAYITVKSKKNNLCAYVLYSNNLKPYPPPIDKDNKI